MFNKKIFLISSVSHFVVNALVSSMAATTVMVAFETWSPVFTKIGSISLSIMNLLSFPIAMNPIARFLYIREVPLMGWIPIFLNSIFWGYIIMFIILKIKISRRRNPAASGQL